jgi:hypothetical protein
MSTPLTILGSTGAYYTGIEFGGSEVWKHNAAGVGDLDVRIAGGSAHTNIVYKSYSVCGDTTTFETTTLESGYTITTKVKELRAGVYRITITHLSAIDRWVAVKKIISGVRVSNSSTVLEYQTVEAKNTNACPFQAVMLHHTSGEAVGLIADSGFHADWCLYNLDYVEHTNWYNTGICSKTAGAIALDYGQLKNKSTADYTVRLQAGVPRDTSFVICIASPTTQASLNAILYSALHDAFAPVDKSGRSDIEKMLWATAYQMTRIKRHILVEGVKRLWAPPSPIYSPLMVGDATYIVLGIDDSFLAAHALETIHNLGPADGTAPASSCWASAGNNMDGSYALYPPLLEYYAATRANYSPSSAALAVYLETADSYADAINSAKMVPDSGTRRAHLASGLFAGAECLGYGNFEEPLSFVQGGLTIDRWIASGSASRVGVDSGSAPHEGNYQAKLVNTASLRMMKIAVPPSKTITLTAWANIPLPFSSGGFRLRVIELDSSLNQVASTASYSPVSSTARWQQESLSLTLNSATTYMQLAVETEGNGTAYVDDVQCSMADTPYPGMFWSLSMMPPQVRGNTISPNLYCMVWAQLNMRCLKALLGANWTPEHQRTLDAIDSTFPAMYWTDSRHIKLRDDPYHHYRKNWLMSQCLLSHYLWMILAGQKILQDAEVAAIYENYPALPVATGGVAFKGWYCHIDGSGIAGAEATEMNLPGWDVGMPPGTYVNGASWLWAGDAFLHRSAVWAGVTNASEKMQERLEYEVSAHYHSHECSSSGPEGYGYPDNVIALPDVRKSELQVSLHNSAKSFRESADNAGKISKRSSKD